MTFHHVGSLVVAGLDTEERGLVVVRRGNGRVALGVSVESNGDAEVVLRATDCAKLVALLKEAIESSAGEPVIEERE